MHANINIGFKHIPELAKLVFAQDCAYCECLPQSIKVTNQLAGIWNLLDGCLSNVSKTLKQK